MIYIEALLALLPIIKALLSLFIKTPKEKRKEMLLSVHQAVQKASETGNTSDIEGLIK